MTESTLTMRDWDGKLDALLKFSERDVLPHAGEVARLAAETKDMEVLKRAERQLESIVCGERK